MDEIINQTSPVAETIPEITPKKKLPILALIIPIIFIFLLYIIFKQQQLLTTNKKEISENIIPTTEPAQTPTNQPISANIPTGKITFPENNENKFYLVKKIDNENINIYSILPINSVIKNINTSGEGYISADITINNQEYSISAESGGKQGPCPMTSEGDEPDLTHCGYTEKKINTVNSDVIIEGVRVWKDDSRGIFLLNPLSINIENKYFVNSILVTKKNKDTSYSQDEIDLWFKIFSYLNIEKF